MRIAILLTGLAVLASLPHAQARERRIYKPFVVLAGSHSEIQKAEHHRITKQADLEKLWRRHAGGGAAAPVVDFKRCMVIAVFGGERANSAGIYPKFIADGISRKVDVTYVARARPNADKPKAVTTPFGLFVVERWVDRVVVKEESIAEDGSTKREERAEFKKLGE